MAAVKNRFWHFYNLQLAYFAVWATVQWSLHHARAMRLMRVKVILLRCLLSRSMDINYTVEDDSMINIPNPSSKKDIFHKWRHDSRGRNYTANSSVSGIRYYPDTTVLPKKTLKQAFKTAATQFRYHPSPTIKLLSTAPGMSWNGNLHHSQFFISSCTRVTSCF